jgi:hypothetical protein
MIALCVCLLSLSTMFLGAGLLVWGWAGLRLERARSARASEFRHRQAAETAEAAAEAKLATDLGVLEEIERVREAAVRCSREAMKCQRWTREDHVEFGHSVGWDRPDTSKN